MHRVELKDMDFPLKVALLAKGVPNAPCGVESWEKFKAWRFDIGS